MLFNSYIFIFLFLPLTLGGWYLLNRWRRFDMALWFLCAMSLWFYAFFNPSYLLLILGSILMNYGFSAVLSLLDARRSRGAAVADTASTAETSGTVAARDGSGTAGAAVTNAANVAEISGTAARDGADAADTDAPAPHRFLLTAGVGLNLAVFFYFKYFDFFIENINAVFHTNFALRHILLPLGISFFTFQQLSFLIDRCLGKAPHYRFIDYLSFVTFFPQLIAGPIVLYEEMMPQFADTGRRRFHAENFSRGIVLFVLGLAKKVLLADALAIPANYGFAMTWYMDSLTTILVVLSYTFELYFDFSGYCDMAMGIAEMFNITLPVNFRAPYRASCIREFWQRWHITLQRFFTRYVYIPLGGSRRGTARTMLNIMLVFALSGLWHGADWSFIAWGLMHGAATIWDGLGIIVPASAKAPASAPGRESVLLGDSPPKRHGSHSASGREHRPGRSPRYYLKGAPFLVIPRPLGTLLTMLFFMLSLIFFRSESLVHAAEMLRSLFRPRWPGYLYLTAQQFLPPELYVPGKLIEMTAPALVQPAALLRWLLLLGAAGWIIYTRPDPLQYADRALSDRKSILLLSLLFVWSVVSLSGVSTFLYFNF